MNAKASIQFAAIAVSASLSSGAFAAEPSDHALANPAPKVYASSRCEGKAKLVVAAGATQMQCGGHWSLTLVTSEPVPVVHLGQGMQIAAVRAALIGSEMLFEEAAGGSLRVGDIELRFVDGALDSYRGRKDQMVSAHKT